MDIEKLIARLENDEQFIDAISDAIEALRKQQAVVETAKDVNDWLIRTGRKDTAHQKHLASTLAALEA